MKTKLLGSLAILPLLIAGCGGAPQSPPTATQIASATPSESPTATQSASAIPSEPPASRPKSSRGYQIRKAGEGASIAYKGKTVVRFAINSIQVDPDCTGEPATPSENGHLVALNVSAETDPAMAESPIQIFGLVTWKGIGENGRTFTALMTNEGSRCLKAEERFPEAMRPGQKATGTIILDVPTPTGILIYQIGNLGWEWEYPAK